MKPKKQQKSVAEHLAAKENLKKHDKDAGSAPVQIAALTARITHLMTHLAVHKGDKHTRRGLIGMVSHRRRLLKYLKRTDATTHGATLAALGLRK